MKGHVKDEVRRFKSADGRNFPRHQGIPNIDASFGNVRDREFRQTETPKKPLPSTRQPFNTVQSELIEQRVTP